jgi:hypothetical protein
MQALRERQSLLQRRVHTCEIWHPIGFLILIYSFNFSATKLKPASIRNTQHTDRTLNQFRQMIESAQCAFKDKELK